jgi:hypothetical protein
VTVALGVGWVGLGERLSRAAVRIVDTGQELRASALVRLYALRTFLTRSYAETRGALADEAAALVRRVGDPWLEGLLETFYAERGLQLGALDAYAEAVGRLERLVVVGEQRRWFRIWSRAYAALAALYAGQAGLARRAAEDALADSTAETNALIHGVLLATCVHADAILGRHDEVLRGAEEFLRLSEGGRETHWYGASAFCYTAAGLSETAVRLDDNTRAVRLLETVIRRGRKVVAPYFLQRVYLEMRRVELELLEGRKGAAHRRLERMERATLRVEERNLVLALLLRDMGRLEGGTSTATGRRILRRALVHLETSDPRLLLKRELAVLLGEPLPDGNDAEVWREVARTLGMPPEVVVEHDGGRPVDVHRTS